jgi:D-glucosaminate-6-phosphate ammonia-lyase
MKTEAETSVPASIYGHLGVEPIINCGGVRTFYGNSLMTDQVRQAMDGAARQFVLIDELVEAIGRRIAALTGAEWGMVTAGSAAGLSLAAAACIAGNDPERMLRLPVTPGMRNVALMPAGHRIAYDQAIRAAGCRIHEVATAQELARALSNDAVALIVVVADRNPSSLLKLEELAAAGRNHGVPLLVDAASDLLTTPDPWVRRGADLVVYSVGKFMRGPAATGLLIGRKELVRAASLQASPHQSFGRTMKIGREQMVGALVALEHWLERDPDGDQSRWLARLAAIAERLASLDGVTLETDVKPGRVPKLRVTWQPLVAALTSAELRARLLAGRPRILIDDIGATANSILVDPFNIQDDETTAVASGLRQALTERRDRAAPSDAMPAIELSGEWVATVAFTTGPATHRLALQQDGDSLSGKHHLVFATATVRGRVARDSCTIETTHRLEGNIVRFHFEGRIEGRDRMSGRVKMGSAGDSTQGPVAFEQFGEANWTAERWPGGNS